MRQVGTKKNCASKQITLCHTLRTYMFVKHKIAEELPNDKFQSFLLLAVFDVFACYQPLRRFVTCLNGIHPQPFEKLDSQILGGIYISTVPPQQSPKNFKNTDA
jgi:hypothetical protein